MAHPDPQRRPAPRWLPVIVVVAALLVVGIAAQGSGLQWQEADLPQVEGGGESNGQQIQPTQELPTETGLQREDDGGFTLPPWVSWLILALIVGVPVTILLLLLARRIVDWLVEAPPSSGTPDPPPQHLYRDFTLVEDAVNAALTDMDLGDDARSAIMACWVHFEHASEVVGIDREHSDTPADLVRKLLERHELDGEALARLSEAYLRARYSPHQVGEADRDRAREALIALQGQLGVRGSR